MKEKITGLKAKQKFPMNRGNAERTIKGNTVSKSGVSLHKVLGTKPRMKARSK